MMAVYVRLSFDDCTRLQKKNKKKKGSKKEQKILYQIHGYEYQSCHSSDAFPVICEV